VSVCVRELRGSHGQGGQGKAGLGWLGMRADDEGAGIEQWVSLFIRFSFLAYGKRLRSTESE
jgi:hypothetical protein